ncbi:MAG TPA: hypothetical protein DEH78_15685, partial [Solibacterales bacterium]|nr:hypothetical protein [Bryobacterales bacterium]
MTRRTLLSAPALAAAAAAQVPESVRRLRPMTAGVAPIQESERLARLDKARRLMAAAKIDAVFMEPGPSMQYFTGVRWGRSERTFGFVLPAKGEPAWIVPGFEEMRARELVRFSKDIRTWEEDESPFRRIVEVLRDRGIRTGRVGIEESVRFFLFDGIRRESTGLEFTSADPVTAGCRMHKSATELALMQRANDIAVEAFKATFANLREGMTQYDIAGTAEAAFQTLGARGGVTFDLTINAR